MTSRFQHSFLTIRGGARHGVVVHLGAAVTTVGRHHSADVVINDPVISRKHAELALSGDGYFLRDLGSKNGTFVNQQNIEKSQHLLTDGDEISFGTSQVTLTFQNIDLGEITPPDAKVTEDVKWSRLVVFRHDE